MKTEQKTKFPRVCLSLYLLLAINWNEMTLSAYENLVEIHVIRYDNKKLSLCFSWMFKNKSKQKKKQSIIRLIGTIAFSSTNSIKSRQHLNELKEIRARTFYHFHLASIEYRFQSRCVQNCKNIVSFYGNTSQISAMLVYLNAFVCLLVWRLGGNKSVSKQYMKKRNIEHVFFNMTRIQSYSISMG